MSDDSDGAELVRALQDELRQNRSLMESIHESLEMERREPPPWVDGLVRRIQNLEHDMYGNGRDGIKTAVTRIEAKADRRLEVQSNGEVSVKVLVALVGGLSLIVSAIVSGLFMLVSQ